MFLHYFVTSFTATLAVFYFDFLILLDKIF